MNLTEPTYLKNENILLYWFSKDTNKIGYFPIEKETWKNISALNTLENIQSNPQESKKFTLIGEYYDSVIEFYLKWVSKREIYSTTTNTQKVGELCPPKKTNETNEQSESHDPLQNGRESKNYETENNSINTIENTLFPKGILETCFEEINDFTCEQKYNLMVLLDYLGENEMIKLLIPPPTPTDPDCVNYIKTMPMHLQDTIITRYIKVCCVYTTNYQYNLWHFTQTCPTFAEYIWNDEKFREKTILCSNIPTKGRHLFQKLEFDNLLIQLEKLFLYSSLMTKMNRYYICDPVMLNRCKTEEYYRTTKAYIADTILLYGSLNYYDIFQKYL